MNKRIPLEIIADLLVVCLKPQMQTTILNKANLSYAVYRKYITRLVSLGFVEGDSSSHKYQTTSKGKKFLVSWNELVGILRENNETTAPHIALGSSEPDKMSSF